MFMGGLFLRPIAAAAAASVRGRARSTRNIDGGCRSLTTERNLQQGQPDDNSACNVFINHRGADTKHNFAALLHDRLVQLDDVRPFLDEKSMKPGERLCRSILSSLLSCNVGIAIFSPRYCESLSCLTELAMLVENKKKLIPIFYDVKPSQLQHLLLQHDYGEFRLQRFGDAIHEAQYTVGFTFDSHSGNWSDLLSRATDVVVDSVKASSQSINYKQE